MNRDQQNEVRNKIRIYVSEVHDCIHCPAVKREGRFNLICTHPKVIDNDDIDNCVCGDIFSANQKIPEWCPLHTVNSFLS